MKLKVKCTSESGIPVVTVSYDPELMCAKGARTSLAKAMIDEYKSNRPETHADRCGCIIVIDSDTAGSPLIRALLELYKTVTIDGGQVRIVGYPREFMDSLAALGVRSLPGWGHSPNKEEALKDILGPSGDGP